MSDLDNQGSLPSYVEHAGRRSPRAEDVPPRPGSAAAPQADADEQQRADAAEGGSNKSSPFEPSTGEENHPGKEPAE